MRGRAARCGETQGDLCTRDLLSAARIEAFREWRCGVWVVSGRRSPGGVIRIAPYLRRTRDIAQGSWMATLLAWLGPCAVVGGLGAVSAGYWPTAWGWALAATWAAVAIGAAVRSRVVVGWGAGIGVAGLAGYAIWTVTSALWAPSATQPILAGERAMVYVAIASAVIVLIRQRHVPHMLGGAWAAITALAGYGLLTRIYPDVFHSVDPIAGYRLDAPLGYWNALGLLCVIGLILGIGIAARFPRSAVRACGAASIVVLVLTLYFTYSRGAWLALGVALCVLIALDARRRQLLSAMGVIAPWPILAIWHASHIGALTTTTTRVSQEASAGHREALLIVVWAAGAAVCVIAIAWVERHVRFSPIFQRLYGGVLAGIGACVVVGAWVRVGSPVGLVHRAYAGFMGQAGVPASSNLNARLFSFSNDGRTQLWTVAWHQYTAHRLLGTGAGTFLRYWDQYRPAPTQVINAHNLYLETLAELGPIGLGLLVVGLCAPLVAAVCARRHAWVAIATAAYVALLVHAAIDWDWQMPALIAAGLCCAGAVGVVHTDATTWRVVLPGRMKWAAVVLASLLVVGALVIQVGNDAVDASRQATTSANYAAAITDATAAMDWVPWSYEPWEIAGEAQAARGQNAAARVSIARAISIDPSIWQLWLDLAVVTGGMQRTHAFARAEQLNPMSPEIASWKASLAQSP